MNGYLEILISRRQRHNPFPVLQIHMYLEIIHALNILDVSSALSFSVVKLNSAVVELC